MDCATLSPRLPSFVYYSAFECLVNRVRRRANLSHFNAVHQTVLFRPRRLNVPYGRLYTSALTRLPHLAA